MAAETNHLQTINWRETLPWLVIFRSFSAAASRSTFLLAFIGVIATPLGWLLFDLVLVSNQMKGVVDKDENRAELYDGATMARQDEVRGFVETMRNPYRGIFVAQDKNTSPIDQLWNGQPAAPFMHIAAPFQKVFDQDTHGFRFYLYVFFGALWTLAVWSFVGVGICRSAVLKFTREEPLGPIEAIMFSVRQFLAAISAIGIPLICVFLLAIPGLIAGLFLLFDFGTIIAGIFWFVVIGCSIVMAVLLVGLLFGWPLMIASVSAEEQDGFDAMSKAYAYLFARPLSYLFYVIVALIFGGFCYWIAVVVLSTAVNVSQWSASWTATWNDPPDFEKLKKDDDDDESDTQNKVPRLSEVFRLANETPDQAAERREYEEQLEESGDDDENEGTSGTLRVGQHILSFWQSFIYTCGAAFVYSLFFCLSSAVYLVLRKDVDDMEMDEVSIREERRSYELPKLQSSETEPVPQLETIKPNPKTEKADPPGDDQPDEPTDDDSGNDQESKDNS